MGILALIPEPALWVVAIAGLAAFGFGFLVASNPGLIARGQDAAGRGMAAGCMMILMMAVCAVLGLFTAGAAFLGGPRYSTPTRIIGYIPLGAVLLLAAGSWIAIQIARSRRRREEYARKMAIPLYILVHDDEAELSDLYNTLRTVDPATDMILRDHPLALRCQFDDYLPRAKVLSMKAWCTARPGEQDLSDTSLLLAKDLAAVAPVCPILLYGSSEEELDSFERILSPKWTVHRLRISGDNWLQEQWLPAIKALLPASGAAPAA